MRDDAQRLADVVAAADAFAAHLQRGDLADGLVFDAVRVRLIEIGEAVKAIDPTVLASEPDVPWQDVAGMWNHLAHRYFDTPIMRSWRPPSNTICHRSSPPFAGYSTSPRNDAHPYRIIPTHPYNPAD